MGDLLFAQWTCGECQGKGVVSGERSDTRTQELNDPANFNCYYCQTTVTAALPEGLDRWELRVEGLHALPTEASCPRCLAPVLAYWDERGAPLLACAQCAYCARLPEAEPDPLEFEILLESRDERIERRRVSGGWEFRSSAFYKEGGRMRPAKKSTHLTSFEADPGRPLAQVFKEIRAEHARLREAAGAPAAEPPVQNVTASTLPPATEHPEASAPAPTQERNGAAPEE